MSTKAKKLAEPRERWRRFGWLYASIWLFYLADPLSVAWKSPSNPARYFAVVALTAFAALYIWLFHQARTIAARDSTVPIGRRWSYLALLLALGAAAIPAAGQHALAVLVYVAAASVMLLPSPQVWFMVTGLVAVAGVAPLAIPGWSAGSGLIFGILVASFAVWGVAQMLARHRELVAAQEEIARLAVAEERARTARDLHDILGHSLTVITVKAELAGRLMEVDPAKAAQEVADLERLSREALADVRSTIGGYREVTLTAELASARSALAAAGIASELPSAVDDVPSEHRALFAWAVREGVTNVVRHSGARHCAITMTSHSLQIVDDGSGPASSVDEGGDGHRQSGGHGLLGLRERARQLGGHLVLGRAKNGGFLLRVEWPDGGEDVT